MAGKSRPAQHVVEPPRDATQPPKRGSAKAAAIVQGPTVGCSGAGVEPGDAVGMAREIAWFAAKPREARAAGKRGRQAFEQRYARPFGTTRYRRLLEEVAGSPEPNPADCTPDLG